MTDRDQLMAAARAVRQRAYAPYSTYLVGCAISAGGQIYLGANVENASYGLSICAERVACATAAIDGVRAIDMVAVMTATSPPAAPCGMCLQTLREFCVDPDQLIVVVGNALGEIREFTLSQLIPQAFHKALLTP